MAGLEQYQGFGLQQTLSPQMQQSLHILQAPLQDLLQMTARELMENPTLEEERPAGQDAQEPPAATSAKDLLSEYWEPYYQQSADQASEAVARHQFLLDSHTRPMGLGEEVQRQLSMLDLPANDRPVAEAIVGNLDSTGFLAATVQEIAAPLRRTPLEVEEVLLFLQERLDPPGLAARDLRECLLLQLQRAGRSHTIEAKIVEKFLPQLARRRLAEIAKSLGTSVEQVESAATRIADLEPNPAREFDSEPEGIIIPEVFVEKEGDEFTVRLNDDALPRLRISNQYKDMLGEGGEAQREARSYLREKIREGRFFLRSIEQRNETILAIAKEIVIRQIAFMDRGPDALKPMTMSTVAEAVGVHETTVSRAVSGKYMSTPQGVQEMKYFFTAGYVTEGGEQISNESVRKAIADLIAGEAPQKPLSDSRLVDVLKKQGLTVARRTIAKYRDQLGILPSHLRKR